jgi:peroxiredoxin
MGWRRKLAQLLGMEAPLTNIGVGKIAPNFSLEGLDGKEVTLSSLLQRGPVVVAFFKISCPVCQFTFPFLQRIYEQFTGKIGSVVGVSQDDPRSTKEFNQEYGVNFPVLIDSEGYPVSNAYGLTNVPTILLLAPDGKVIVSCMGFDKAALEKISKELGQHEKIASAPLFLPDEVIPAYKPG